MACPTCGHTLHGLGESSAEMVLSEFRSSVASVARRIGIAATSEWVKGELERILAETKFRDPPKHRHFVCPRCGTCRTVTGDFNDDSPPMLVERVKAADDRGNLNYLPGKIIIKVGNWADVRRCIGREGT